MGEDVPCRHRYRRRIIGGKLVHFIESVLDRVDLGLIAHMPLAREIRAIAVFWKNSAIVGVDFVRPFSSPSAITTESAERWESPSHERGAARGAARLSHTSS